MKDGKGEITVEGQTLPLRKQGKFKIIPQSEDLEAMASEQEWHERYGHLPFPAFRKIQEAPRTLATYQGQCDACIKGKFTKPVARAQENIRSTAVGALIHSDICGPLPTASITGKKYFITLVDDFSRLTLTRAISHKSEAAGAVKEMVHQLQRQTRCSIKEIRTNQGGEYRSNEFLEWVKLNGIVIRPTVPYHSQTNSVAERINRTLGNMMRTNLFGSKLPEGY